MSENIFGVYPLKLATLLLRSMSYKTWKVLNRKVRTVRQPDGRTARQSDSQTVEQLDSQTAEKKKSDFEVAHHLKNTLVTPTAVVSLVKASLDRRLIVQKPY